MSDYHIRKYKDADYKTVCDVYVQTTQELIAPLRNYALKLPRVQLFLLGIPLTLLMVFKSFLLSATSAVLILAFVWYGASTFFNSYIDLYFNGDMRDIQQSYMQRKGSCFWVAESNGNVIGMVGAQPYKDLEGVNKVELKHMSVIGAYRRQGIARALCLTMISFARQEGYESVVLETTTIQHAGRKLYEGLGFNMAHTFVPTHFFSRMLPLLMVHYRYDVPQNS